MADGTVHKNNTSLKFIDLFSGCGGFSYGLEMAGHQCLLGVDFDRHAMKTFAQNHQHAKIFNGPIQNLSKQALFQLINFQNIDLVIGGPPCQGFSTVGKGDVADSRNALFEHFVKVVSWTKPRFLLLENVTGLLAKKNRAVLKKIFKSFTQLGYSMDARILHAHDYGVPSFRRRTILVGALDMDPALLYPASHKESVSESATHGYLTVAQAWKLWLLSKDKKIYNHDLDFARLKNNVEQERLQYIPEGKGIRYQADQIKYLPAALWPVHDWEALPENRLRQTILQRLDRKKPAPTILTSHRSYYHPTEDRYLTPRELAALQSFPGDFIFHGSNSAIYRQIGNAVPPLLAKAFGLVLQKVKMNSKTKTKKFAKKKLIKKNLNHVMNELGSGAFTYKT